MLSRILPKPSREAKSQVIIEETIKCPTVSILRQPRGILSGSFYLRGAFQTALQQQSKKNHCFPGNIIHLYCLSVSLKYPFFFTGQSFNRNMDDSYPFFS